MGIQDMEEFFNEALREIQARELGLIPEAVDIWDNMSLRILLSIWSTTEVLNNGLHTAVMRITKFVDRGIEVEGSKGG